MSNFVDSSSGVVGTLLYILRRDLYLVPFRGELIPGAIASLSRIISLPGAASALKDSRLHAVSALITLLENAAEFATCASGGVTNDATVAVVTAFRLLSAICAQVPHAVILDANRAQVITDVLIAFLGSPSVSKEAVPFIEVSRHRFRYSDADCAETHADHTFNLRPFLNNMAPPSSSQELVQSNLSLEPL